MPECITVRDIEEVKSYLQLDYARSGKKMFTSDCSRHILLDNFFTLKRFAVVPLRVDRYELVFPIDYKSPYEASRDLTGPQVICTKSLIIS